MRILVVICTVLLFHSVPFQTVYGDETDHWQMMRASKAFAIMRHAVAPGTGDPSEFTLEDCSTQRNLSDQGRQQARRAGAIFRQNGIEEALIFTSQWCRCRETARLLDLGPVADLPALNSFFGHHDRREPQTRQLKEWITSMQDERPYILVTHQVNISALLGRGAGSGEIMFVSRTGNGEFRIEGSVNP
jgi:phosphohistidine phosphatase SixA